MLDEVLIVVPTLGRRPELLRQTLDSIRAQDRPCRIVIVGPEGSPDLRALARKADAELLPDPGSQPLAVNLGVEAAGDGCTYVNWLGDDDLLLPGSVSATSSALDREPQAVVAYGACRYIDAEGRALWTSSAGRWAQTLLPWGPDLIPQPGMLVRRSAWLEAGGLDAGLRFAFDLDLLLKLRRIGSFVDVGTLVSCFRWHPDSLTVSDRSASLDESEAVKRRYLGPTARRMAWTWEKPVRGATRLAARSVTRRARRRKISDPVL